MLVNDIDISTFHTRLLTKDIQTAGVTTFDDWLRNALNPLYMGKQEQYKQIKIKLYIKDSDEESALNDISNLVIQLERCTIKFDDLSFYYDCLIISKIHTRVKTGVYNLEIELKSGYAYKPAITTTMNNMSAALINVEGNLPSPAIITITPNASMPGINIEGFTGIIVVANIMQGVPFVIDGEACTVMADGVNRFNDVVMTEFPTLLPGKNPIGLSTSNCLVTISYKPKFI